MFKIYVMDRNFLPKEVSVCNRENGDVNVVTNQISSIYGLNSQLSKYILSDKSYETNVEEWFESEDIKAVCFYIMRWRRCTAYLVIQFSDNGYRYLCYFSDEVKHQGQSFGTTMELVNKKEVFDAMKENLKLFLNESKIMKIFLNDERKELYNNIDNFEQYFGF